MYRHASGSGTAGPSGAQPGINERTPLDLGDLDKYGPGPGHILKYPNSLTMTVEARLATREVTRLFALMRFREGVDL